MTRNLPVHTTTSWPDTVRQSAEKLAWIASVPTIPESHSLSGLDRQWVEMRVTVLHQHLQPADGDNGVKGVALMALGLAYPAPAMDESIATVRAGQFLKALAEYPAWAVEQAADDWLGLKHEIPSENRAFAPSPPQLVRLVRIALNETRLELSKLQALLTAKVEKSINPEMRERIGAKIIQLSQKLGTNQQNMD